MHTGTRLGIEGRNFGFRLASYNGACRLVINIPRRDLTRERRGKGPPPIEGRLSVHRDGFGFVIPDQPVPGLVGDIFLPKEEADRAMHGDRVAVRISRPDREGKAKAKSWR